jgi:hypothetical protein
MVALTPHTYLKNFVRLTHETQADNEERNIEKDFLKSNVKLIKS